MNVSGTMIQDCGEMLRNARKEARVSQTELAERIQTTKSYISRIENGVIIPSVAVFYRMIAALGMSANLQSLITNHLHNMPAASCQQAYCKTPL